MISVSFFLLTASELKISHFHLPFNNGSFRYSHLTDASSDHCLGGSKTSTDGGDEFAMKAASCEFRGLREYLRLNLPGLGGPLTVLVDYLGYRITASSLLPLAEDVGDQLP